MVVDSGGFQNEHFQVFRKIITKALSWITSDLGPKKTLRMKTKLRVLGPFAHSSLLKTLYKRPWK